MTKFDKLLEAKLMSWQDKVTAEVDYWLMVISKWETVGYTKEQVIEGIKNRLLGGYSEFGSMPGYSNSDKLASGWFKDALKDIITGLKARRASFTSKTQISRALFNNDVMRLRNQIDYAIGNSFPDGEPGDELYQYMLDSGWNAPYRDRVLQAALRLINPKYRHINDYLADMWDDAFASSGSVDSLSHNPWRPIKTSKHPVGRLLHQWFRVSGKYTINANEYVSVIGNVYLAAKCDVLPVKFQKVTGDFICAHAGLITLNGSPKIVGGRFNCSNNMLYTLVGGPKFAESYICDNNNLTSFEGGPTDAISMYASDNPLKSLDGLSRINSNYWHTLTVTYRRNLPLLKTLILGYNTLSLNSNEYRRNHYSEVENIINSFCNTTTSNEQILECAKELIAAGYAGNATI